MAKMAYEMRILRGILGISAGMGVFVSNGAGKCFMIMSFHSLKDAIYSTITKLNTQRSVCCLLWAVKNSNVLSVAVIDSVISTWKSFNTDNVETLPVMLKTMVAVIIITSCFSSLI